MSSEQTSTPWARSFSRRAALRSGGIGLAASSIGLFGLNRALSTDRTESAAAAQQNRQPSLGNRPANTLAESGSVSRAVSELDAIAADALERTGAPGLAIAVVHNDDVAYLKGYGVRDARTLEPIDADTVFQLASLSKPIASTVIAGLVGDGVVEWDSRIADLLPEFEMSEPWVTSELTIRDMFVHRSGLPEHAGDLLEDIGYGRDEVLHRLRYQEPATSFRSGYAYTNFGFTAAAVAAANAAGLSWEDLSEQRLYGPLGMNRTSSRFNDFTAYADRARGHVMIDGRWRPEHVRDPDAQSPAGGVSSTVRDTAEWMRLHLGNGTVDGKSIVAGEALAETHRPQVITSAPANPFTDLAGFYGLGWNVGYDGSGRVRLSHSGAFALGASTSIFLLPSHNVGICVLANVAPIGLPEAVAASFIDVLQTGEVQQDYIELFGQLFADLLAPPYSSNYDDPPVNPSPDLEPGAYTGIYDNRLYGEIEIVSQDNELALLLGPDQMEFPLRHYDRDVFLYPPPGENAAGLSSVTFTVNPDGKATSVVIDNLNMEGQGRFDKTPSAG